MKKVIIILFLISIIGIYYKKKEDIIIPNEAIRFRVIANSNNLEDQYQKLMIKDNIEKEVYDLINNDNSVNDVRDKIQNNMEDIKKIINKYNVDYEINYGLNYFPAKNYKGIIYPSGNYEALVITLGEGLGDNFWCVLFPPLCLMDNQYTDTSEIEYKSFVKELFKKF